MSGSSSNKRKQNTPHGSRLDGAEHPAVDLLETSRTRRRKSSLQESSLKLDDEEKKGTTQSRDDSHPEPSLEELEILELESEVCELGAKVLAFREKGVNYFALLSEERVRTSHADYGHELQTLTAEATSVEAQDEAQEIWGAFKERLAAADEVLPNLLKELTMWNTKVQLAVEVRRKGQRLPFLDRDDISTNSL